MDIHGYPGQPAHSTSPVLIIVRGRVLQRIFNRLCPQPLDLVLEIIQLLLHHLLAHLPDHGPQGHPPGAVAAVGVGLLRGVLAVDDVLEDGAVGERLAPLLVAHVVNVG